VLPNQPVGKAAVEIVEILKIYEKFVWVWPVLDKNTIDSSQISLDQDSCMVLFSE